MNDSHISNEKKSQERQQFGQSHAGGKFSRYAILLVLPLAIASLSITARLYSGPFWSSHNLDPDYSYLFNSLAISYGLQAGHSDHPGSLLQLIGAGVIQVSYLISGTQPELARDVISRPEFYLSAIHGTQIFLVILCIYLSGWIVFKCTNSKVSALIVQSPMLLTTTSLNAFSRVMPEPLLFCHRELLFT